MMEWRQQMATHIQQAPGSCGIPQLDYDHIEIFVQFDLLKKIIDG